MAKTKNEGGKVKVRVLVDCTVGACNTVVEIDESQLAELVGKVDPSPEAVAYVKSQGE